MSSAAQRVELVDEVFEVPAHEWRYVEFGLKQLPVTVECEYARQGGADKVRLLMIRREQPRRVREEHLRTPVAATAIAAGGRLDHQVRRAGDYAIVIDNRTGEAPVPVHLRVSLRFGPVVTYLSPQKRLAVILISFAVFFGIVTWSARRLLGALR